MVHPEVSLLWYTLVGTPLWYTLLGTPWEAYTAGRLPTGYGRGGIYSREAPRTDKEALGNLSCLSER